MAPAPAGAGHHKGDDVVGGTGGSPEKWRKSVCHMAGGYEGGGATVGHWKVLPDSSMSLIRVSIGVFPTRRTKKSCSITDEETVRSEGSLRRSLPNLVG